jgi:hypothetical protein
LRDFDSEIVMSAVSELVIELVTELDSSAESVDVSEIVTEVVVSAESVAVDVRSADIVNELDRSAVPWIERVAELEISAVSVAEFETFPVLVGSTEILADAD